MGATALKIKDLRTVTITTPLEDKENRFEGKGVVIQMYQADENYAPIGRPEQFVDIERTEEEWTRSLRKEAIRQGHFIPEYSTNPEWNISLEEEEDGKG